jgi:hypothetical protein
VPLVDGVASAVRLAEGLTAGREGRRFTVERPRSEKTFIGISSSLAAMLGGAWLSNSVGCQAFAMVALEQLLGEHTGKNGDVHLHKARKRRIQNLGRSLVGHALRARYDAA